MADGGDGKERKIGRSELQGWLRFLLTILALVGAVYYSKGQIDAHMANKDIHNSITDLAERFVLRREYDNNIAGLRDDLRYLRNRIDMLIDRIDERSKREGR